MSLSATRSASFCEPAAVAGGQRHAYTFSPRSWKRFMVSGNLLADVLMQTPVASIASACFENDISEASVFIFTIQRNLLERAIRKTPLKCEYFGFYLRASQLILWRPGPVRLTHQLQSAT